MIGRIKGTLISLTPPSVLVDVCGLGYEIDIPMSDCIDLPSLGSEVVFYTHMVIREDLHALFGFLKLIDRDCFRQLIKVSGIGPRIAMALLSTLSVADISIAIENSDVATLCRTPGIGKKMAERMLLELKGKFTEFAIVSSRISHEATKISYSIQTDIINALDSLGYNDKEIANTIKHLPNDLADLSLGIKEALKLLNKHK